MSFLRRLIGRDQQSVDRLQVAAFDRPPAWMHDGMQAQLCDGRADLEVVGESHYQDNLWRLVGGRGDPDERVRVDVIAVLAAEPDNPHDANAVSGWVGGLKVGYLSREDAQRYQPGLLALQRRYGQPIALPGVIVGGGMRSDGPGMLGVFLRHNPADFGLRAMAPPQRPDSRLRTGLSDAIATDGDDDSYDLGWLSDLPADDIRAITMLRQLLRREVDPIDRHFMYVQLEALLYRSRDAFTSALDEYDQTCHQHDAEMDTIRQALVAKWGQVPVLDTYRQMAIRQQKAKNFEQALWWAERGIVLYGADAARPEAVDDLKQRADANRRKLEPLPQPSRTRVASPGHSEIETLLCTSCGRAFQRRRIRGRKPLQCPECRNERDGYEGPENSSPAIQNF
jgi:predicted Zn-ribbon and HTH transcriptional regulator